MKSRFFTKVISIGFIMGLLFISLDNVWGQQDIQSQHEKLEVSDTELIKFAKALHKLQAIQDSTQQEMVAAIESTGLDLETYNKVMRERQNVESMEDVDASEKVKEQVQGAYREIRVIQISQEQKVSEIIQEEGLESDRFREILQSVQQDPELRKRLQGLNYEDKQ